MRYEHDTCQPGIIVRADGEKVRQMVLTLRSDVMKFTSSGGAVRIGCWVDGIGGDITVTSVADERTTFTVSLPTG